MRRLTTLATAAAAFIGLGPAWATTAHAQVVATLDAGAATVHYDDYLRSSVLTLTPSVRVERPEGNVALRGTTSFFESGNHSIDLAIGGSVFTHAMGKWRGEGGGSGGLTVYKGAATGNATLQARAHRISGFSGLWLGASAGMFSGATEQQGAFTLDAGSWLRRGGVTASLAATGTSFSGARYATVDGITRWNRGVLEYVVRTGLRVGDDVGGARQWADASATVWLGRHLAVSAGGGAYPSDPARGAPGGRYAVVSMRLASRAPALREAIYRTEGYTAPIIARPVVASFRMQTVRGEVRRIRIRAPGAHRVELAGDFTDWSARAFASDGSDGWQIELVIPAGAHHFNVRVDAGAWGVPPDVSVVRDEFGGVVGLILVG